LNSMQIRSFLFSVFYFLLFLFPLLSYSQSSTNIGGKKIEIVHATGLYFADNIANGAQRLVGDVEFKHENALMFCDSAYFYKDNSLDAFGHIHIKQGDSLNLYGDSLKYDGNTKKAIITHNVIVTKGDMQLTTNQLNYDISTSVGYYITPAKIINKDNTLTSDQGYFFGKTNELTFKKNVVLVNPQFVINSDTMRYNTSSRITYFNGPTTIKSKENLIYCEDGWYDTFKDLSRFSKNSYIITKEQKMFGDSLYYDRIKGIGRAVKNVEIIDTTQNLNIKGDYAIHYELKDLSIVTGHALLTQKYDKDTLFLHADTLKAIGNVKPKKSLTKTNSQTQTNKEKKNPVPDNPLISNNTQPGKTDTAFSKPVQEPDSMQLFAYHKVKFYKKDLQGKCDSLAYTLVDSTMKLFNKPTLWSDENQLTADSIKLNTGNKSLKSIELRGSAFIVSKEDSLRYDQIRGKYMKGNFKDNKLYMVNVIGNGQTIYFVKEKEELKAVNRADCTDLHVYLKDNKIDRITFITKPDATLFPLDKIDVKELKLKDFTWREKDKPLSVKDIFIWDPSDTSKTGTKSEVEKAGTKRTISGKVTQTRSYCGGAAPSEEMLKDASTPQIYAQKKFYIRKGSLNTTKKGIELSFTSDDNGAFSFQLAPGTYSIIVEEQVNAINVKKYTTSNLSVDKKCLNDWWKKPYYLLVVTDKNITDLNFNFYHKCFVPDDIPCVEYTGPMPP
ncbi:MAG: OstA-like protein, partial [Bacteroidia bacterium]